MTFGHTQSVTVSRVGTVDRVVPGVVIWPSGPDVVTLWLPVDSDIAIADLLTLADGTMHYVPHGAEQYSSPLTGSAGTAIVAPRYPQMLDTITIERSTGHGAFDPATGGYAALAPTVLYTGVGRVDQPSPADREVQAGEAPTPLYAYVVSVPIQVADVRHQDRVLVTASPDPALVGLDLRVRFVDHGAQLAFRRLGCEEEGIPG